MSPRSAGISTLLGLVMAAAAAATPLDLALDVQGQGLVLRASGVGLEGIGTGTRSVTVNIGGPVQAALLYWGGRDRPCPENPAGSGVCFIPSQPYKDQVLRFEGTTISGAIAGSEGQPVSAGGPINNIGYLADVTSIVQAKGTGPQTFAIQDADPASNLFRLNGATLVVVFTDPAVAQSYRVMLFDGLDFAYGEDPTPGPTRVTVPVVFQHGAAAAARSAELGISSGDTTLPRPDRIDIGNNPSLVDTLDSSAGHSWDADAIAVQIPAGVAATTVQLFSEPVGANPDSLLWILATLRVPLAPEPPGDEGCTPGYWKNHPDAWAASGYALHQSTQSVFAQAGLFPALAANTLRQSLREGGGPALRGGAQILLRAAVAALLNAAHPGVDYPRTTAALIADVDSALASGDRAAMIALAAQLDADNNLGCPLS